MNSAELKAAIKSLGISQAEFARRLSDLSGKRISAAYLSDMCSSRPGSREPSALVRVAVRLMLEQKDAQALVRSVERWQSKRER